MQKELSDKIFEDKNFKVTDYFNKVCLDKDIYSLNDLLIELNKDIQSQEINKRSIVKDNFSKFILCKSVLDKIKNSNSIDKTCMELESLSRRSENLVSKYAELVKKAEIDVKDEENENFKSKIQAKYYLIFNAKEILTNFLETKNYAEFVKSYKKIKRLHFKLSKSEHINSLYLEARKIKNALLDILLGLITKLETPIEDILTYFEYILNLYNFSKKEKTKKNQKIQNTLLVNIKIFIKVKCSNLEITEVDQIFTYFVKVLKMVNKYFIEDLIIKSFFENIEEMFENSKNKNFVKIKIFLSKLGDLKSIMQNELQNTSSIIFVKNYKILEEKVCAKFWKNSLKILRNDLKKNERNFNKKIISSFEVFSAKIVKKKIEKSLMKFIDFDTYLKKIFTNDHKKKFDDFKLLIEFLEDISDIQYKIDEIKSDLRIFNQNFDFIFLNNFYLKLEKQEILAFAKIEIKDIYTNFQTLVAATKLKRKLPKSFNKLLVVKKEIFLKNDILKYFLDKKIERNEIEIKNKNEIKELRNDFEFLLENNSI